MMVQLNINHNRDNGAGVIDEGPTHSRADVHPKHCQIINLRTGTTDTDEKFGLGSLNVGTMKGRAGEIVETFTGRKVDVCCVQKIRWEQERMVNTRHFGLEITCGLGGARILVARKWTDKIFNVECFNDRLMMIKLFSVKQTVAIVWTYAP